MGSTFEIYLDSVPASQFNATCVYRNIQPAEVTVYHDWVRQGISPLYEGKTEQYKTIKLKFIFTYADDNELHGYAGGLTHALEKCQLKMSNMDYYYDCVLDSASLDDAENGRVELNVTLKSSYAYLSTQTDSWTPYTVENVIQNGDFSQGTSGWSSDNIMTVNDGVAIINSKGIRKYLDIWRANIIPDGNKLYEYAEVMLSDVTNFVGFAADGVLFSFKSQISANRWIGVYSVKLLTGGDFNFQAVYSQIPSNASMQIRNVVAIDMGTDSSNPLYNLTADELNAKFPDYFDGTIIAPELMNAAGNLPTPAVVTLTPTQDIGSLTLTGLTKKPVVISNLHANVPVTVDGEKCIVTETSIDSSLTSVQGTGNWIFRKYNMASFADPDDFWIKETPDYQSIPVDSTYFQSLIPDGANLVQNIGYDYLGYLKTALYVSADKNITFQFMHDDGVNVYLNGVSAYSKDRVEDNGPSSNNSGYPSVVLKLTTGWNRLEFIWIQHYGNDGIFNIMPTIGSQVEQLNAYYACDTSGSGLVNKFGDANLWAFPTLQPGSNIINTDSTVCGIQIGYKPKFM